MIVADLRTNFFYDVLVMPGGRYRESSPPEPPEEADVRREALRYAVEAVRKREIPLV